MDKIGVFLCTGCGIGDGLNVDEVIEAANEKGCAATLTHECLCAPEGIEAIRSCISENGLDGLLLAACSERPKALEFAPLEDEVPAVFRTAIREHCTWSHPVDAEGQDAEDTTMLAQDLVRMGLARLDGMKAIEPLDLEINETSWWSAAVAPVSKPRSPPPAWAIRSPSSKRPPSSAGSSPTRFRSPRKSRPTMRRRPIRFPASSKRSKRNDRIQVLHRYDHQQDHGSARSVRGDLRRSREHRNDRRIHRPGDRRQALRRQEPRPPRLWRVRRHRDLARLRAHARRRQRLPVHPTARNPNGSRSSSAPDPATRTTSATVRRSVASTPFARSPRSRSSIRPSRAR